VTTRDHHLELDELVQQLCSPDPSVALSAIEQVRRRLPTLDEADYRHTIEALMSLFYVDLIDLPELEGATDRAIELLAAEGARVVPIVIAQMRSCDIKSHFHLARTLGLIGTDALARLRTLLATDEDPCARAFALYAIGKMTCAEVEQALPEVLGGLMHPNREVRDTAARTLGRLAAVIPAEQLTPRRRAEMADALMRAGHDVEAPVRAKALRSLGRMASVGLLDDKQRHTAAILARNALGESEEHHWDTAYIVRREAREALDKLT